MKRELKKLWELAEEYVEWGKKVNLNNTHNDLRGRYKGFKGWTDGNLISVYFAHDGETWTVEFNGFVAIGYKNVYEFPIKHTVQDLRDTYLDAKRYLDHFLTPMIAQVKQDNTDKIKAKIKAKQEEIEILNQML